MKEKFIDTEFCFLDDVGNGEFKAETYISETKRSFNNCPYKDPDASSKKLYLYHQSLWQKKLPSGLYLEFDIHKGFNLFNKQIGRLSSDYIGPSASWAIKKGISDREIAFYLKKTRTIGGHMIWPVKRSEKNKKSINQARGGRSGLYDRIDLTLINLKRYYDMTEDDVENYKLLEEYKANADWFDLFETFRNFIDFFLLQDFVDEDYKIIELAPLDPILPLDYESFIANNVNAIEKRNRRIKEELN